MKILLSWLNELMPQPLSGVEVRDALLSVGIEVASLKSQSAGLEKVITVRILETHPHPNADRLTLCKVTDGSSTYDIVCGARNMKVGDIVALATPGAKLPNDMEIKKSKIRGEVSEGMLCSESELKLAEESEGILILSATVSPGQPLAKVLNREDSVLELELTPNRGDCLSVIGIAREVAASMGVAAKVPTASGEGPADSPLRAIVQDLEGAPRYVLRHVNELKKAQTPELIRQRLEGAGLRSIHPVVDITNYVLLEWGQPLHAFDQIKVQGTITVRRAEEGEKILCLDEIERTLTSSDLVIADEAGAVAIAGVMGGKRTAVSETTTSVWLESAYFDPKRIRLTARRLGLSTDASYRFERGVDPAAVWMASQRAVELLATISQGKSISGIDLRARPFPPKKIQLRQSTLLRILGEDLKKAGEYLARLGLSVEKLDESWMVEVPTRRPDLEREIDLVEEVARIHGYSKFGSTLPSVEQEPSPNPTYDLIDHVREIFWSLGFREARTYSFASAKEVEEFSPSEASVPKLANPILQDEPFLRPSLLPRLLQVWSLNRAHQMDGIRAFEVGKVFRGKDEEVCAAWIVAGLIESKSWHCAARTADVFDVKGALEQLFEDLGLSGLVFESRDIPSYLHPGRSASVSWRGQKLGVLGQIHPNVAKAHDLPAETCVAEIFLKGLVSTGTERSRYRPLSAFPAVARDLAFVLPVTVSAADVISAIRKLKDPLLNDVRLFDLFSGAGLGDGKKSLALALTFQAPDRTLVDAEVDQSLRRMVVEVESRLKGELRGKLG